MTVVDTRRMLKTRVLCLLGWMVMTAAFLLVLQNFAFSVLPDAQKEIPPSRIHQLPDGKGFAYAFGFSKSEADTFFSQRSRARLFEDGKELLPRMRHSEEVALVGGGRWSHQTNRILFSTSDLTDPRTNGRVYVVRYPVFQHTSIGLSAALVLIIGTFVLYAKQRSNPPRSIGTDALWDEKDRDRRRDRWKRGVLAAGCLLLVGLYFNSGTLSPYGNTNWAYVEPTTGYLYNADHPHFRVLFDFINGAPRKVWNGGLMLRRILYPVLAWPAMKIVGFELGGAITSIILNIAGFFSTVFALKHYIGRRGSSLAAWLLALYPGFCYWGALPYPQSTVVPLSLLLTLGLEALENARGRAVVLISFGMGVSYLAYDLLVYFVPATLLMLFWARRPRAAIISALVQIVPLGLWLATLQIGLGQRIEGANSQLYGDVLRAYRDFSLSELPRRAIDAADAGIDVFFGANFLFLPVFFLLAVVVNPLTSRVRFARSELVLFAVTFLLFLFNNLGPNFGSPWDTHGTWIARIYQPCIGAMMLFVARWWDALSEDKNLSRILLRLAVLTVGFANAAVVFGPVLNNPLGISETAFYRFYNHTDTHWVYEFQLKEYGRRPIGFPHPTP